MMEQSVESPRNGNNYADNDSNDAGDYEEDDDYSKNEGDKYYLPVVNMNMIGEQ